MEKKVLINNLNLIDKYVMIKSIDLIGVLLLIFVKQELKTHIKNIYSIIMKTGFLGTLGNKGNVMVRFDLSNDLSIAISCCHLAAGMKKNDSRVKEIVDIMNKKIQIDNKKEEKKFKHHDIAFIFGDLNFRLELDNFTCRNMVRQGNLTELLQYDQFRKEKLKNSQLGLLEEAEINFNPTYKYDIHTKEYDTSKKNRTPAWCDRILWKNSPYVKKLLYDRSEFNFSDHRPIYGYFKVSKNFKKEIEPKNNLNIYSPFNNVSEEFRNLNFSDSLKEKIY